MASGAMTTMLFGVGFGPQARLGCVLAMLSIGVVVGPKVLSPTQAAAKGAFNAAMPSGKPGKAEKPEKEAVYADLEGLFDAVDWSDPDKKVPGFDDGVQLDETEFASYVGATTTLSESTCVLSLHFSPATGCRRRTYLFRSSSMLTARGWSQCC